MRIVAKTSIKREPGYLYFLRGNVVFRKLINSIPGGSTSERVCVADFVPEQDRVYYLDAECDVVAHNTIPAATNTTPTS